MAALRRHKLATFVLALVAFMLILRLTWGWYAARQLAAELEALRRREPTPPLREIGLGPLPPSENAWNVYVQAIAALKPGVDSPRNSQLEYPPYPPHGAQWEQLAAASEQAHAAVFATARGARRLERSQIAFVDWLGTRRLANTLADGAQHAHLRGDDAEALERLLDVLHLARSVRQDPALVSQLVGIGIDALATDAAQQIVPTLRLEAWGEATPASPAQGRALIAAMLDEHESRVWFVDALQRERAVLLDALNQSARGTWAIRPLADRTAVRWLREFEALIDAAGQSSAGPARRIAKTLGPSQPPQVSFATLFGGNSSDRSIPRYSRWFDELSPASLARTVEQFHRASAERRVTAVIVAARLSRHDHDRWPDDAASLVPKYLDAVPADPFREDGGPVGYVLLSGALPDGGDRPLVYFEAGESRKDLANAEPMYSWQQDRKRKPGEPRREIRQYRDVSLWTPKTSRFNEVRPSAAEAVDGDPDEADAPGDDEEQDSGADGPAEQ